MATPTVLTFDAEGRAVDFEVWVDDLQLFLQWDRADGLSLFDLTSGASPAPPATTDSTVRSQWATRDAAARLAVRRHLPTTERAHFSQYKSAQTLYDAVVARYSSPATAALSRLMLPHLFPDLAAFPTVADLITHLRTSDTRYRAALPAEFCAQNPPPKYITLYYIVTRLPDSLRLVRDHFLSVCPTTLTVDLLETRLLAAETSIVAVGASRGDENSAGSAVQSVHSARLQLRERFDSDFPVLRLHSDRGGEFSSSRLGACCCAQGIRQTFTLPASPQQNGIAERRIGMVMDVARTSMIHAAAPQFLWPFAVQYAAHQLNLQPRVSLPETSPTLRWTGKVGDASAFRLGAAQTHWSPGRHRPEHMAAAKRVLRYLCSTSGLGLVLGGRSPVVLTGHADPSWVDDLATQRSSQGYTFSLGSGSVSWRSTRSSSVLSSSCEAEIYAGAMAAQELHWLTYLLTDLGEPPRSPPVLYVDNKVMLALCREHRLEHRRKHIAFRYFLAHELQQRGQLRLAYVASEANTADIFTKALAPGDHQRFCTMLACFALLDWSCDLLFSPTLHMGVCQTHII
ncbi:unnamed protein product [Closterium sp. NIES-53]